MALQLHYAIPCAHHIARVQLIILHFQKDKRRNIYFVTRRGPFISRVLSKYNLSRIRPRFRQSKKGLDLHFLFLFLNQ